MVASNDPSNSGRVVSSRQALGAGLILALALTFFLWRPIAHGDYFDSSDVLQQSPAFEVDATYLPENPLLGDPVSQMHPWLKWNRSQLADFNLPVWNPYNAGGTPHLANYQSAVFSPFSAPFYLLSYRLALIAATFLKLFALGFFTYLFLRRIRVSHLAAIVGAVGFTYGSFNVLWVSWPHPGAAIGLPASLYFAEVALHSADRRRALAAWGGFSLALACGLLVGHPETFFFTTVVAIAYLGARVLLRAATTAEKVRDGLIAIGCGVLALGVAALQLLPFFEYLNVSTAKAIRDTQYLRAWDVRMSIMHVFPDLFGRPDQAFEDTTHYLNYQDAGAVSVGLVVMFLGGVAVVSLLRRRSFAVVFFSLAALAWLIYAYDLGGLGRLVGSLPLLRTAYPGLSVSWWLFATSVLAALGVDVLLSAGSLAQVARRRTAIAVLASGFVVAGACVLAARMVLDRFRARPGASLATAAGRAVSDDHVRFVLVVLLVAVVAAAGMVAVTHRWVRLGCWSVLLVMVFAGTGFRLRDYNPTIDRRFVYPETASINTLRATVGNERTLLWGVMAPDVNLWYRITNPDSYDAMGVADYDVLYRRLAGSNDPKRFSQLLSVLGVRWVASAAVNPFPVIVTDSALYDDSPTATAEVPLATGEAVSQTFSTVADLMGFLTVAAHPVPGQAECRVDLTLFDVATDLPVRAASAPCVDGAASLAFAPLRGAPQQYRAELRGVGRLALAPASVAGGELRVGGGPTGGHVIVFGHASTVPELETVGDINAPVKLFRVRNSPAQFSSPPEAQLVPDRAAALQALEASGFDVTRRMVIEGKGGDTSSGLGTVEVVKETPTDIRLRVEREDPGWVLALQSYYPGWTASVNGRPARISRANAAFSAVPVGSGTSEVSLRYRPASVRLGLVLTVLSGLLLLALIGQGFIPRAHGNRPAGHGGRISHLGGRRASTSPRS